MKSIMKSFVLVTALFASHTAISQENHPLKPDDVFLGSIAGEVLSIHSICPEGVRCITNGTAIKLAFQLGGCLDSLGPVTHDAIVAEDGTLDVFVSAIRISNKRSLVAFCTGENIAHKEIFIHNLTGDANSVRMHFLGTPHSHQR